ncbi:MAG: hypothetical protein ACXVHY_01005 [Methanobacterium sp.]
MELKLNKGLILGIIGGTTVFLIALLIILNNTFDFDQQLIYQVDSGVPADKLIPQIDKETQKMTSKAKNHLSEVINKNLNKNDSMFYQKNYEAEIKIISQYDDIRKRFARREISKNEFLKEIEIPKYAMNELYKY